MRFPLFNDIHLIYSTMKVPGSRGGLRRSSLGEADRAERGGCDKPRILGEDPVPVLRARRLPPRLALGNLRVAQLRSERPRVYIDFDYVAVAEEGDQPTRHGFRGDVSDHQAVGCAREAPIGQQGNLLCEAPADYRRRDGEHLAHTRTALRPLVPNDHDVAFPYLSIDDLAESGLLGVEDSRWTSMITSGRTRRLEHRSLWGEVPPQDGEPPRRTDGSSAVVHDILPLREGDSLEPFFDFLACDSSAFAV